LEATSTKLVSAPDFSAYDTPVCDEDGNVYYHVGKLASYSDSTIFRLSSDEDRHQIYKLPAEIAESTSFGAFNVTPSGRVWVAVFNEKGEDFVYAFDDHGDVASRTHLEIPQYLLPNLVAVFETDALLWKGHFAKSAGSKVAGTAYAAAITPSGKVVSDLSNKLSTETPGVTTRSLPEGAIAIGSDGNAYLLSAGQILVISQSGKIVRKLLFSKPDAESRAVNLYISGGLLAITFFKVTQRRIDTTLLVLDSNTGSVFGYYEPSEELGNNPVCFSRTQGFTFMGRDKSGKVKLTSASLR
jgi:hypothetical protein